MICDVNICSEKHVNDNISEYVHDTDEDEFVKCLRYKKREIIQLIHRQMHKFHNTQFKLCSERSGWQAAYRQELQGPNIMEYINKEANITDHNLLSSNSMSASQAWDLRILKKIRERICIIILIAGIIALIALIYDVYFRMYLCNSGKSCVASLRFTRAKHALF